MNVLIPFKPLFHEGTHILCIHVYWKTVAESFRYRRRRRRRGICYGH